jgi:hypothetical protein
MRPDACAGNQDDLSDGSYKSLSGLAIHILVGTDHSVHADALTCFWILLKVKCPSVLSADASRPNTRITFNALYGKAGVGHILLKQQECFACLDFDFAR